MITGSATDVQYTLNGSATAYSFPNKISAATDLAISLIDTLGNIYPFVFQSTNVFTNTLLGLTATVANVGVDAGATVTLSALGPTGWEIDLRSNTPELQLSSIRNQGPYLPDVVEDAFDKVTRALQDLNRLTYQFGIHGPDAESVPWGALPGPSVRAGNALMFDPVTGLPVLGIPNTQMITTGLLAPFLNLGVTDAERAALVMPVNAAYPELDIRRYGALTTNTGAVNAAIIQQAVLVLAQHTYGELLIPAGFVFPVAQVVFASMSQFNIRCDGVLQSTAAAVGGAFANVTSNQGLFCPLKFTNCTDFKVYGKGYINNGWVDAFFIASCGDFDWTLDCRGTCTNSPMPTGNSNMNGINIVASSQFRLHDMTVDSICSQNMNNSTDVYYAHLNNINCASANTGFELGPNITSRKAGYGAFFVGSNCFDFSIHDNIGEFNSGTACQIAWTGGGSMPQRFSVSDNIWRYNQEDAFCVQNGSGTPASIGASVTGNVAIFSGWCNCQQGGTQSAGGGAGINFLGVDDFVIGGNSSTEHTTGAVVFYQCARVSGDAGAVYQQLAANAVGIEITGGVSDIKLSGGTIHCAGTGAASLLRTGACVDVHLDNIAFTAGQISDSGICTNCKMTGIVATCPSAVAQVCDWIDCGLTVTGTGQQGLVVAGAGTKLIGTIVNAPSHAIVLNTVNDCYLERTNGLSSAGGIGIQVIACNGVGLMGCVGSGTSGAGIAISGASDRAVLINCKGSSASGNSLNMASASVTNATLISFRSIAGSPTLTGATFLTGMNVP